MDFRACKYDKISIQKNIHRQRVIPRALRLGPVTADLGCLLQFYCFHFYIGHPLLQKVLPGPAMLVRGPGWTWWGPCWDLMNFCWLRYLEEAWILGDVLDTRRVETSLCGTGGSGMCTPANLNRSNGWKWCDGVHWRHIDTELGPEEVAWRVLPCCQRR